ncbi:MAG: hypothetical protein M1814_005599 [Vezdaea aestivalis]|nr:MAG: hypothetical protein M1814_005599 [Vezdaea aestivalis]
MSALLPFRDINVHASATHYAFTSPSSPSAPTLVVDRPTGDLRLNDGALLGGKRVSSIAGILGIIKLRLDKYIIVITKAQPMGRLKGHMVYKIIATELLPLRERPLHDHDEDTYIALLKTLLRTGSMCFSYSLDLTNSFQRQAQSNPNQPLWQRADDRFFWNRFLQTDLVDFRNGGGSGPNSRAQLRQQPGVDPYILPVIFGMVSINATSINNRPISFVLITRRSRHRAGTRYFSRGIDEQGHVSNFNETEQVVVLNDSAGSLGGFAGGSGMQNGSAGNTDGRDVQVLSYVQTRGSVPVFWAEVNNLHYSPKLEVRGVDSAVPAARLHFDEQIRIYGDNYLVNLVNQKGREERVKKAYEQMIRNLVSSPSEAKASNAHSPETLRTVESSHAAQRLDRLHYVYFDFHNETKGLKWHRTQLLLDQLSGALDNQRYFLGVDMPGSTGSTANLVDVRSTQTSVVRTNCMDCLDRTNVVQSMLARRTLTRMMQEAGVLRPGQEVADDAEFEILFRNTWADNADAVSKTYSGTGALKTDFTRTGQRTKAGALQDLNNSITRYAMNNFRDGPRQDGFDLLLGAYLPSSASVSRNLLLVDRRPLLIQAIPYVAATSAFMVMVAIFTRRLPDAAVLPLRFFTLFWFVVGLWSLNFMYSHGSLYVRWPKLNPLPWALEDYSDALASVRKDKVIGQLINRPDRSASSARLGYLEEGKKRIE